MNHLERVNLLIVSPVREPASPPLFPLVLRQKTLRKAIKRTSSKWCGFHLHVCVVWVRLCLLLPKKIPSRPSSSVSGTDFTAHRRLRIAKNHKKKKHTIWYFSGNLISGSAWCQACVWRDLGKGVLRNESVHLCLCVQMGEVVIILVCAVGSAGALLWHATRLHSICSNQNKNTPGVDEAGQAQPGHKTS